MALIETFTPSNTSRSPLDTQARETAQINMKTSKKLKEIFWEPNPISLEKDINGLLAKYSPDNKVAAAIASSKIPEILKDIRLCTKGSQELRELHAESIVQSGMNKYYLEPLAALTQAYAQDIEGIMRGDNSNCAANDSLMELAA